MPGCRISTLIAVFPAFALCAGLRVNDTLNDFQIYGKEWVCFYGDGRTADGALIGSDRLVDQLNNTMKIGGSIVSGDSMSFLENIQIAGSVNCRGNLYLTATTTFSKRLNVGGSIRIRGANPAGNVFADSVYVRNAPIQVSQPWATNSYSGVPLTGSVWPATPGKPGNVRFGVNLPFPTTNMDLPDTTVDFDPSKNCVTASDVRFNMSMCGLGGPATDSVLTPGRYGDFEVASGNRFYFGPGLYQFRSLRFKSDGTKALFLQGKTGVTRVLVDGDFTVESGNNLVAPSRYTDPTFNAGTVLIYSNGKVTLGDDVEIWATVVAPMEFLLIESGLKLFGQAFSKGIQIENGFDGSAGKGKWIPAQNKRTLKYSIIHFKHDK